MEWNLSSISKLKRLWKKETISTSEIGDKLGVTKNAVVGKAHRLGLDARKNQVIKKIKRKKAKPKIVEKKTILPKKKSNNKKGLTLMELKNDMCHWPMGDPRDSDFSFCGAKTVNGKPYCLKHCTDAYTVKSKEKKQG